MSILGYYLAPNVPLSGADIAHDVSRQESTSAGDESTFKPVENSIVSPQLAAENLDLTKNDNMHSLSDTITSELAADQVDTFAAHMAIPGAQAESYVLLNNALQFDRVGEFKNPEQFDQFAATMALYGDASTYERAAEYTQAFESELSNFSSSVTVSDVSCGESICAAKFQSPDTEDIDQFLEHLRLSESVPMYVTVRMPAEAKDGYDIRRVLFTTDPSANEVEIPVEID